MIFNPDFQDFIQALNDQEVNYILVGGYSVIIHGYSRTTGDMDIWVNPTSDNYGKLVKAFDQFKMPVFDMNKERFLDSEKFDVFSFGVPPIAIEIMTRVKGLVFENAFENADWYSTDNGLEIRVLSLEDLKKAKKAAGRYKDLDDLEHLT